VIATAESQSLSAKDQKLSSLYQPDNESREHFLRTKYQSYVNENMH